MKQVRHGILPGNSKSLWDAVKIANNKNVSVLPYTLFKDGLELPSNQKPSAFGELFYNKVTSITNETLINPNVYNGHIKLNDHLNFSIEESDVEECIRNLN